MSRITDRRSRDGRAPGGTMAGMHRIAPGHSWALHDAAATRALEAAAAAGLPPHTLMQRAGSGLARLARALEPHARRAWVACGPGNNGGDGLEAAGALARAGLAVTVTWLGSQACAPADARASLARAREAGVQWSDGPPAAFDLAIDALLGMGASRPLSGTGAAWADRLSRARQAGQVVLAADLPSGLSADTGCGPAVQASHTLSLLTLKPGLFTAQGRDAAGEIWFDPLGVEGQGMPTARLNAPAPRPPRPHDSHKGRWGDVAVVGGAPGMAGAALLAAGAALHAGAGRVFVALLDDRAMAADPTQPELMLRPLASLDPRPLHAVVGCGGGDAVRPALPRLLSLARTLVLDADALNAVAQDASLQALLQARGARGAPTVLTPHPLEAARLLGLSAAQVQADRLAAAGALAGRFGAVTVLKGSGTVIAAPGQMPRINPTGDARLATGGTGDVLAGWIGAGLAEGQEPFEAACEAVYAHGAAADAWPAGQALTASALAARACRGTGP